MDPLPSTSSSNVAPLGTVVHSKVNNMNNDPLPWMFSNNDAWMWKEQLMTSNDMLNCKRSFEPNCFQQLYWTWSTCFLCFTPYTTVLPSPPTSTSSFSAAHVDAPIVQSRSVTTSPVLQPQLSQSNSLEMAVLIPIVLIIMSNKPDPHVSRFLPTRDIIVDHNSCNKSYVSLKHLVIFCWIQEVTTNDEQPFLILHHNFNNCNFPRNDT